ncbi:MAG TPA: PIN domain-containing protein, partial [Pseudonocardia sp.]
MIYIDTSALLKLVRDEAGSRAMRDYLAADGVPGLVSSSLITVEARRGTMRSNPARLPRID